MVTLWDCSVKSEEIAGVGAACAGHEHAGRSPAFRLDHSTINGTNSNGDDETKYNEETYSPRKRLLIIGCKCRSAWCPRCGVGYWGKIRAEIQSYLHIFKKPRLLTLTIDPKKFESGEDAKNFVDGKNGYIRRLMRLMGFKKGFRVLAFHSPKENRPDGHNWPHWHIVVDIADCGGFVNLKRLWRLWRDKWGAGGCDLQINRKYRTAQSAVNYCVSYCQHQSGVVADWALASIRSPRAYELYGELRKRVADDRKKNASRQNEEKIGREQDKGSSQRRKRVLAERLYECGEGSNALIESSFNGESNYRWAGQLIPTPGQIALLSKFGILEGIEVEKRIYGNEEDGNYTEDIRISIYLDSHEPSDMIDEINRIWEQYAPEVQAKVSRLQRFLPGGCDYIPF